MKKAPALILNFDQIIASNDLKITHFYVEEWGGSVCLRPMNAAARARYEAKINNLREADNSTFENAWVELRAKVIADCLCNEDGELIAANRYRELLTKSADAVFRLFEKCLEISGIGMEGEKKFESSLNGAVTPDLSTV